MYSIDRIKIKNFMAHIDSEFVIKNNKAIMVYGINNVDQGQKSNGSGKSAILESIAIALLGSHIRKDVTTTELISYGKKSMKIELYLINSNSLKNTVTIKRTLYANTNPSEVEIRINGVKDDDLTGVTEANKFILETLQISREDLLNYFLLSKEKYTPFLQMSDTAKKNVIGRFSQSNLIDPAYDVVDNQIEKLKQKVKSKESQHDQIQGKIEAYQEQIDQFDKTALENRRSEKIKQLQISVKEKSKQIDINLDKIEQVNHKINHTKVQITQRNKVNDFNNKINKIKSVILQKRQDQKQINEELTELRKLEGQVVKALSSAVQCPQCNYEFSVKDESIDVKKAKENKQEISSVIEEVSEEQQSSESEIDRLNKQIDSLRDKISDNSKKLNELNKELTRLSNSKVTYENSNQNLKQSIKSINEQIKQVKEYEIEDPTKTLQHNIDEQNQKIEEISEQISQLDKKIYNQEQWNGILTKFKTHLANKTIGVIEAYCNEYLNRMGSDITIRLEGYKTTRSGKIREKITAFVLRNGIDQGSFGTFSSGERAKIQVAMILGLQQLINTNTKNSSGLNLCFFDEVIESLDSEGIHGIMKALNTLNQTVIVVTHGTFEKNYPHICTVTKNSDGADIKYK